MGTSRRTAIDRRRRLEQATAEIRRLKGALGEGLYRLGSWLGQVHREQLWRAGGHASFAAYLRDGIDVPHATAFRAMRIAEHFNAQIAARYGVTKLDAAIRYLRQTPADERPGDLLAAEILVRDARGRYQRMALHQATAAQIDEATANLRDAQRGARRIPRAFRRRVERLAEALPPAPPGTRSGERVRVLRGHDGRLALSFQAIAFDDLPAFVQALQLHLEAHRRR